MQSAQIYTESHSLLSIEQCCCELEGELCPAKGRLQFEICSLYVCKECKKLCCAYCVTEEPACYYCPGCFFEYPSASIEEYMGRYVAHRRVNAGQAVWLIWDGRCRRGCYLCPKCGHPIANTARMVDSAKLNRH